MWWCLCQTSGLLACEMVLGCSRVSVFLICFVYLKDLADSFLLVSLCLGSVSKFSATFPHRKVCHQLENLMKGLGFLCVSH